MKAVRVATNARGRSISASSPRGSPADTPRLTNRAVSTRAWKPEPQHTVSPGASPPNTHVHTHTPQSPGRSQTLSQAIRLTPWLSDHPSHCSVV